jgi:hypothetical protein
MALRACSIALAMSFGVACASFGPHLKPHPKKAASASASAPTPTGAAPSASAHIDEHRAHHLTFAAIGCFTAGAWVEALGALGEERTLATTHRCRMLATDGLGAKPDNNAALDAARTIDPAAVDAIVAVIGDPELVALVRATADAAREASAARKIAESLRKDGNGKIDDALAHKDALAKLYALKAGERTTTARLVALVVAADHVESSRGLPVRAKVLAAAPAFEIVFAVPRPTDADAWIPYVAAAAKAGNHPAADNTEKAAFAGVVTSFADKFEALVKDVPAGEPQEVAAGYAKRLRAELADAAKKKTK